MKKLRKNAATSTSLNDQVEKAEEQATDASGAIDTVRKSADAIRDSVNVLKKKLTQARAAFDQLSDGLEAAEEALGEIESDLDEVEAHDLAEQVTALDSIARVLAEVATIDLDIPE